MNRTISKVGARIWEVGDSITLPTASRLREEKQYFLPRGRVAKLLMVSPGLQDQSNARVWIHDDLTNQCIVAPYVPTLSSPDDTKHFEAEFTK